MGGSSDIELERNSKNKFINCSKEQLKTLFYLFNSKPDSRIKIFNTAVQISMDDIIELNDGIMRKLSTHNIDSIYTTINVGFVGADIHNFTIWEDFKVHHWEVPECIEEIVIKWDFMVNIDNYELPQRHTLLVRISSDIIKPGKLLQMIAADNSDEFDKLDMLSSPAFCRVDFINASISKELINIVSNWYEGRSEPELIPNIYYKLKKMKHGIAIFVHNLLPLIFLIVCLSGIFWFEKKYSPDDIPNTYIAIWLFISISFLNPISKFGRYIATHLYINLSEFEGSKAVFNITTGDNRKINSMKKENEKIGFKFFKKSLWAIVINVIGGLIVTYFLVNT